MSSGDAMWPFVCKAILTRLSSVGFPRGHTLINIWPWDTGMTYREHVESVTEIEEDGYVTISFGHFRVEAHGGNRLASVGSDPAAYSRG
jgi:hypothetical protein